jgi:biofilm PGA synthesis N-glycosyltransferase PgaC
MTHSLTTTKHTNYFVTFLAGLSPILVIGGTIYYFVSKAPVETDPALRIAIRLIMTFLIILIIRYFCILWFGYLKHIEEKLDDSDISDFSPPVTILVPAYNEGPLIQSALRYLLELNYPAYEILVIDDGSSDDTYALASEMEGRYGDVTLRVVSKKNAGKANALNTGISLARNPFVVCMDGDTRLSRDVLYYGMRHFRNPRIGAVSGNVKVSNRVNLWTKLQALEYIVFMNGIHRAMAYFNAPNIIPGPLGIFRRDMMLELGGYDTDTYAEDCDLTLKILASGWHITTDDRALAYTEVPENLNDLIKQRYRWTRGILQALRKRTAWLAWPKMGLPVWIGYVSLYFEGMIWPPLNVAGNLFFAITALRAGVASHVFYWWVLFTLLDIGTALFMIMMEEEDLALAPYAAVSRFFFISMIDVSKVLATIEEFLNVEMNWGKLDRVGRI